MPANPYMYKPMSRSLKQLTRTITTIKLVCSLTKAVQQHRGSTMGYLSGAPKFLPQAEKLQANIERILAILSDIDAEPDGCIPKDVMQNIHNDWKTILVGWQDDQVMRNFEFHCHLVDSLNKLLRYCMKEQLTPYLQVEGNNYQALLETLFIQLPNNIELIATLRGLSTNVAVIKACGTDSHNKISFLLKEIPKEHKLLLKLIDNFIPGLMAIKDQQKELYKFLLTIQMTILDAPNVTADSASVFKMSTDLINVHWNAMDQGIQFVEHVGYQAMIDNTNPTT